MLDEIRKLFTGRMVPHAPGAEPASAPSSEAGDDPAAGPTPVQLAACALMLELAHADQEFSEPEQRQIEGALVRHFSLDGPTAQSLVRLAEEERRQAIDHFQFTRLIHESYDLGQKMVLAEVLWGVALADETLAEHESYLLRKIAYLLQLEPGYLNQARRSAAESREKPDVAS
jgi:uncharacterized tellurite resistance protein B-like protein